MTELTHPNFTFALRDGATLRLPATDLTEAERVMLVASIARALGLYDIDLAIQKAHPQTFSEIGGFAFS